VTTLQQTALVIAAASLAACSSLSAEERPAVVAEQTAASRAALERAVTAAAGRPVTLAPDALTRDSVLTLEQREPSPAGRVATGRTLDAPLQLKLVLRGDRCVLVREADGGEWPLEGARCVPAPESR
jgi:hypothetical protein